MSHVTQYGILSWLNEPVAEFEGNYDPDEYVDYPIDHFWKTAFRRAAKTMKLERFLPSESVKFDKDRHRSAVNSRDIKLHYLFSKVLIDGYQNPKY